MDEEKIEQAEDFRAPVPYPFFDTIMAGYILEGLEITRVEITSGRCHYTFSIDGTLVGVIELRTTINNKQTIIYLHPVVMTYRLLLQSYLAGVWASVQLAIDTDKNARSIADIPSPKEMIDRFAKQRRAQRTRRSHEPPAPNASIDDWLDWREGEKERGRPPHAVSFPSLAGQSNYSVDQFKRASRNRTKNRTK